MNVSINTHLTFQSKANPIRPFAIKTKRGRLKVAEVTQRDLKRENFIENLTMFFCKNFASFTKDPAWQKLKNRNSLYYADVIKHYTEYYASKIKDNDDNMTLLLAKDKRNKIQGACLSYGYDRIPDAKDKVCYIDSIAINPSYRGFSVGKMMMEKTLESATKTFTDAFLAGEKMASKFYLRLGFMPLNKDDAAQKAVIDFISQRRSDCPKYVDLYTKPLRELSERWYNECANEIK